MREPATIMGTPGRHVLLCRETIVDWKAFAAGAVHVEVGGITISGWVDEIEAFGHTLVEIARRSAEAGQGARTRGLRVNDLVANESLIVTAAGPIDLPDDAVTPIGRDGDLCHICDGPLAVDECRVCRTCLASEDHQAPAFMPDTPLRLGSHGGFYAAAAS